MGKTTKSKFKAIIFDMDGVITNTMPYHFDAWLTVMATVGIRVNCYDIYKREGQDGLTSIKELYRQYRRKFDLRQARHLLAEKEHLFKQTVKRRFIPGSLQFIKYLKKKNYLLGLVTGTSRQETEKLLSPQLLRLFDVSVAGNEARRSKPNPDPFLKAIKLLGVPVQETLVIENAPFGIQAAKRAGVFCVALETSLPKKYLKGADMVFHSFPELKKAISRWR